MEEALKKREERRERVRLWKEKQKQKEKQVTDPTTAAGDNNQNGTNNNYMSSDNGGEGSIGKRPLSQGGGGSGDFSLRLNSNNKKAKRRSRFNLSAANRPASSSSSSSSSSAGLAGGTKLSHTAAAFSSMASLPAAAAASPSDEVDPLDAFMSSIQAGVVPQDTKTEYMNQYGSMSSSSSSSQPNKLSATQSVAPTISLAQIMAGSGGGKHSSASASSSVGAEDWESDATTSDAESEDDERAERDHREFMNAMREKQQVAQRPTEVAVTASSSSKDGDAQSRNNRKTKGGGGAVSSLGRVFQGDEVDAMLDEDAVAAHEEQQTALEVLAEAMKKKELKAVDHSTVDYIDFRKRFFIVPRALAQLSDDELAARRRDLEIKIRGRGCPPPVENWQQCGLSDRVMAVINKHQWSAPFPVQSQAIPAMMSGRDVIGIAKTGSGKTLAFLIPLLRHILDQPPLTEGEGPIGLIMAPARELAVQIFSEARKFTKLLGMRVTAVYGGAGVADQIAELKRGAEIVVCTPGRMIDILCMQQGRLISLSRVSFVVMDEADRMFDMGFEPQISRIIQNIRPDRQTALFSATFPSNVEKLARGVLTLPLEIVVGGRSVASGDIKQYVEVREEGDRFMRLLQLLGHWYERGNVLVFVDTKERCDSLFQQILKAGYQCLSLHGGKDQADRDYTISDFKNRVCTLMVATSGTSARGLDVKDLVLVVNYCCPNHLEDYVHRVGRTGRAGRKGTAYTFISPSEEQYSPILMRALSQAKQNIPDPLRAMAEAFESKVSAGEARHASSGFTGKGFTFDESEQNESQKLAAMQKRQYEVDQGLRDASELIEDKKEAGAEPQATSLAAGAGASSSAAMQNPARPGEAPPPPPPPPPPGPPPPMTTAAMSTAQARAAAIAQQLGLSTGGSDALARAQEAAMKITGVASVSSAVGSGSGAFADHFGDDMEINDYPQQARWKVMQKQFLENVSEMTGAAIIGRGTYVQPNQPVPAGERKLYLVIEAPTAHAVSLAREEIQRVLNEETLRASASGAGSQYKKYSVI